MSFCPVSREIGESMSKASNRATVHLYRSVLEVARDHASGKTTIPGLPPKLKVSERKLIMKDLVQAEKDGSLLEVFGTGTAAIISSVDKYVLHNTTPIAREIPADRSESDTRDATFAFPLGSPGWAISQRRCSIGSWASRQGILSTSGRSLRTTSSYRSCCFYTYSTCWEALVPILPDWRMLKGFRFKASERNPL